MLNLLATTASSGSFKAFVSAVSRAKLGYLLAEPGPFTVFVPTDAAFAHVTGGGGLGLTGDLVTLKQVLACHIVRGRWPAALMVRQRSLKTLQGERVSIELKSGIHVGGAHVIKPDLIAENGVIHVVDHVILPAGYGLPSSPVVPYRADLRMGHG